jgi:hypothetical protein
MKSLPVSRQLSRGLYLLVSGKNLLLKMDVNITVMALMRGILVAVLFCTSDVRHTYLYSCLVGLSLRNMRFGWLR